MNDYRHYGTSNFPPVIKNLIIINVLVYLAQITMQSWFITERFALYTIPPPELGQIAAYYNLIGPEEQFRFYQLITHLFTHDPSNPFHLIFNMFILWMFGRMLENIWGAKRFLLFYIMCGLGAAALHLLVQYFRCQEVLNDIHATKTVVDIDVMRAMSAAMGASGAIMGIMAAFAYLFPNTGIIILPFPMPIKAKWLVLIYVAVDLIGGLGNVKGDRIAHFAHLGGAITGFLIVFIWNKTNRRSLY